MDDQDFHAPYMNARVAGMRSHLLSSTWINDLVDLDDVGRVVDALLSSPYKDELAEALTQYRGADAVEEAASRVLFKTFHTLYKLTHGHLQELTQIFLMRWDLTAVKSLLRAKHLGMDAESTMAMVYPGPGLTVPVLRALAEHGSVEELVTALAGWNSAFGKALSLALPRYIQENDLSVLEEALDRAYFVEHVRYLERFEDSDSRIVRDFLRMEIDRINLRMMFQFRDEHFHGDALAARLLPKGMLTGELLRAMVAARDPEDAMKLLAPTRYRDLANELYAYVNSSRFSPTERMFEMLLLHHLRSEVRAHSMSIAVLMHFAFTKTNEVINLRLIARGEANHLPRGHVRKELLYG